MTTMTDANPRKVETLEVNEAEDGLIVYDPANDMVHHLNASASLIFELCDGTRNAETIAGLLAEAYSLPSSPTGEAFAGLKELADLGLIS
jgi:hypothetical protein